jgi:uncharacterized protein (UPF0332 family)
MKLTNDEREAVISFRVQKSKDTFKEAFGIASLGYWNAVANRLYYACYYVTSALLIKNNYEAQTHSGIIHLLGQHYIKEGIVSKESGKLYSRLFEIRQTGDYDDLFNLTEEDVKPLIEKAKNYIGEISELISHQV